METNRIVKPASTYRSTYIRLATEHCRRALDFVDASARYDRDVFHVGNAAHHVLQGVGEKTNQVGRPLTEAEMETTARAVCEKLIAEGREFDGRPEPPLPPGAVWEGRDLALGYLFRKPLYPGGEYEIGLAVDQFWNPCGYGHEVAWLRGVLDRLEIVDESDEEPGPTVATHTDYKTNWTASREYLDSLQMKVQSLLVDAVHGDRVDIIRRRVVNLRTGQEWSADVMLNDPDSADVLSGWQEDIAATCRALDRRGDDGRRPAAPGLGCHGCPYLLQCDAALDWFAAEDVPQDPKERAQLYVLAESLRQEMGKRVRRDCDHGAIEVDGGEVGYISRDHRVLKDGAEQHIVDRWELEQGVGRTAEMLRALGVGVTHAENLAKFLGMMGREGKADRDVFMADVADVEQEARFGWRKA